MPTFKKTVPGDHEHIFYLNDDGTGRSSKADKHIHQFIRKEVPQLTLLQPPTAGLPPTAPGEIPQGLPEPATQTPPPTAGTLEMTPGPDGHIHELEDIKVKDDILAEDEDFDKKDDVERVHRFWDKAYQINRKSLLEAEKAYRYYMGEQWEKDDSDEVTTKQRAALTINIIQAGIKILLGIQRTNRTDMKFLPREDESGLVAEILNHLSKVITDENNFANEESEVFSESAIAGLSFFNLFVDYSRNIHGDIRVEKYDYDNLLLGPHTKKDLYDLEYLVKVKYFSEENLKRMYPHLKEEIAHILTPGTTSAGGTEESTFDQFSIPDYIKVSPETIKIASDDIDRDNKNIRVKEAWERIYESINVFVDASNPISPVVIPLKGWENKDVQLAKKIPGIKIVNRVNMKILVTKVAHTVHLERYYADVTDFLVAPVYAEKIKDRFIGKVRHVFDIQDETNKRYSVHADLLNKVNGYGYYWDKSMFVDETHCENFKDVVATPGFTQELVDATNNRPVREEGIKTPVELERYNQSMLLLFDRLFNVNAEMAGQPSNADSGVAIMQRKQAATLGNEFLFDNLGLAKHRLGKLMAELIQKTYTPERIYRILNSRFERDKIEIGGQPFDKYPKEKIIELLKNTDLTKYDVAVGESAEAPTVKMANYLLMADMAGKGLAIPMPVLIKMAPIPEPDKAEIMKMVMAAEQAKSAEEQNKQKTEILKTLLAKMQPGQNPGALMAA